MKFKQLFPKPKNEQQLLLEHINLFEHEHYKRIPGTNNSYGEDPSNLSTKTISHSAVYAKQKGRGAKLYSVNKDGTGHDGSSGKEIPSKHADYFRSRGYSIPQNNILKEIDLNAIDSSEYRLIILEEA